MTDNSNIIINSARTCAFTGHRTLYKDFNAEKVEKEILNLIEKGYNIFLVGMAVGFDTECFKILLKIKEKKEVKIIACVPCKNQSEKFNGKQKIEYRELINKADEVIVLSEEYSPRCMKKRNEFMVDNCSVLIAYLRRDYGGTSQTVKIAEKYGKQVIFI